MDLLMERHQSPWECMRRDWLILTRDQEKEVCEWGFCLLWFSLLRIPSFLPHTPHLTHLSQTAGAAVGQERKF